MDQRQLPKWRQSVKQEGVDADDATSVVSIFFVDAMPAVELCLISGTTMKQRPTDFWTEKLVAFHWRR